MAGVSDRSSREIARRMGCNLVYTEMISAEGLARGDAKTIGLIDTDGEAPPVAVQLFGVDPHRMAQAARIVQDRGADLIDINAGCPARKVVNSGAGAALLRDLPRLAAILRETRKAITIPLTLKIRSGWDAQSLVDVEAARMAEIEGLDAIALHPRTRQQAFGGAADWTRIAAVRQAVSIPVIGNGDVWCGADARRMARETGCDAVMIGRGAMGNPWALRAALEALTTDRPGAECDREVPVGERLTLMMDHARSMVARKGERRGVLEMRKLVSGYLKGIRDSRPLRMELMTCETLAQMEEKIGAFKEK